MIFLIFINFFSLAIWLYLTFTHGRFWHAGEKLHSDYIPDIWPEITIIIPARNETSSIWPVITSHLTSHYQGPFSLILIDDHSNDGTGDLAMKAANADPRFTLITPPALEKKSGWTGKLWGLHHGVKKAKELTPNADYYLLTDADIVHHPETLSQLVANAKSLIQKAR